MSFAIPRDTVNHYSHGTTWLSGALTVLSSIWAVDTVAACAPWWPPILTTLIGSAALVLVAKINTDGRIRAAERERDEAVATVREMRARQRTPKDAP